jgi:valyl-tRNA synthetase
MKPLPKQYDQQAREKFWQEHWANSDVYHYRADPPRDRTFVIDTPPPTVSGVLHMGHIFSYTQADFIARYQRMKGKDVFYPMGFDDNGLPTERLVEKIKGVRGAGIPRAEFVALCREVVKDAENEFRTLFKSAALSVDWRREYQTISDEVRKISQASFIDLLKKGEAYRDFRPTYWDWVDQTAIAQAEIENKEMPGMMNELEFNLEDGTPIVIMTTRPELLGACVAVMYHPEDPKAKNYEGKHAVTPLFGVKVPMIADEAVEREKGTGLVMCCTFGDDTDKEWVRKYLLPIRPIIKPDGKINVMLAQADDLPEQFRVSIHFHIWNTKTDKNAINENTSLASLNGNNTIDINKAVASYEQIIGLKPKQANAKIIELLQGAGKLLKQTPMVHTVKCAERSGTPIEIIPTNQWFVKVTDKKEALLAKGAEVAWYPDYMRIRLNQWIEGLKEDWCVSRQRFFGVPFPVWYSKRAGEEGKILFADADQLPVDPLVDTPKGYKREEIIADTDVMDTWATSSISPQINAKSLAKNALFPADLRPQAHEIIRTWAFYTIAKAHLHEDTIPWRSIMISGWCLAADKTKMSKSKGNVVTPVALIEEKGTDAVRYWASTSRLGTDTAFSEDLLKIGRKLVNKLWNASQFAALNLHQLKAAPTTASKDTQGGIISAPLDVWILSRLHQCIKKATQQFEQFEYCDARVAIEDFFWNDFCDNYLELVKTRAYGEQANDTAGQQSALCTLYHCLEALLRLLAPFVPHICEEIYSHVFEDKFKAQGSIHARGTWPLAEHYPYDANAERAGLACVDVLNIIRKAKSEAGVSIKYPVAKVDIHSLAAAPAPAWKDILSILSDLKAAATAHEIVESPNANLQYKTDSGWFAVGVTLAKIEQQQRNSDQAPHEKLEGKILHAPGNPDLTKQVVKLQVNDLKTSIERQK